MVSWKLSEHLHRDTAAKEVHANVQTFDKFERNLRRVFANREINLMRIFPLGGSPSQSRTVHTWYIDPKIQKHFEEHGMSYEDRLARFRDVVENQDYAMLEEVQLNAERGIQSKVVSGRNEAALQHFHNVYRSETGREQLQVEDM